MNRGIYALLAAQFLSAFADNAILFTVIALVLKAEQLPGWYVPGLQSVFLIAFVVLGPWVGPFADKNPKPKVLIKANLIKAIGAFLILMQIEPLLAYAIVGLGAAVYSPAKYGLLPELAAHDNLVKANSWIEGSTIVAIVLGTVIGARVADFSIELALQGTIALYVVSALTTYLIPLSAVRGIEQGSALARFKQEIDGFLETPRARFAVLGAALFWASAATLRVIIVAWAPLILQLKQASDIAELTLFLAFGIIAGSALAPSMIPIDNLRRTRLAAYAMAIGIMLLSMVDSIWLARLVMFMIGLTGGLFIVPINAAIQEIGHRTIGSGGAVAIQNFFNNFGMLLAVGIYTLTTAQGGGPVSSIMVLGVFVFLAAFLVSLRLPDNENLEQSERNAASK